MYESIKASGKSLESIPTLLLVRVSTKNQSNVQHGSLEQQRNSLLKKVQETSLRTGKNYEVVGILEEDESGKPSNTKNRTSVPTIENFIKRPGKKAVFADRTDRFSRDLQYNIRFAKMILEHKAEYHEGDSGIIDFTQENQYFGFIYRSFTAEAYSTNLSKNVRTQGRRARVNNGKDSSTVPVYGLDPHPTFTCQYIINANEAKLLNELGWYLVKTRDYKATAHFGNQRGIRTKERWTKESVDKNGVKIPSRKIGGEALNAKRVSCLLYSPKVRGIGKFKDDLDQYKDIRDENGMVEFKYSHGPVLSEELIHELDKLLIENRKSVNNHSEEYLLSGFLYTSEGKKYRGDCSVKNNSQKKYRYYDVPTCSFKNIKRFKTDIIDEAVISRLKEYLSGSEVFKKIMLARDEKINNLIEKYEKEISSKNNLLIEKKVEIEKFSTKTRNLILSDNVELQEVLSMIKDEKITLENEMKEIELSLLETQNDLTTFCHKFSDEKFLESLKIFFKDFDLLPKCDKKILLRAFFPRIIIHPDFRIELQMNSCFERDLKEWSDKSTKEVRLNKKWLGRWGSNPRPID